MGFVAVLAAAIGAYAFGAVWYMVMAKPWMKAAGIDQEDINQKDPTPFIISGVCAIIVAGMMRHVFAQSQIIGIGGGLMGGIGIGLFLATPWILTNYAFAGRPRNLMLIDGIYATVGCTIMGVILGWFAG